MDPRWHTPALAGGAGKEMRLLGINSHEDGNARLPKFMDDFNRRFAEEPGSNVNARLPSTARDDLARILTWQEPRTISKNMTVQDVQQNITPLYKGKSLPYNVFHKQAKQSEVVMAKDLNKKIETKSAPGNITQL